MGPKMLLVTLAVAAVLAALPLGEGHVEEPGKGAAPGKDADAWPCCDDCGMCTESFPQICGCRDVSTDGCHPGCIHCVKFDRVPALYQCMDVTTNFCQRRCTPAQSK